MDHINKLKIEISLIEEIGSHVDDKLDEMNDILKVKKGRIESLKDIKNVILSKNYSSDLRTASLMEEVLLSEQKDMSCAEGRSESFKEIVLHLKNFLVKRQNEIDHILEVGKIYEEMGEEAFLEMQKNRKTGERPLDSASLRKYIEHISANKK